MKKISSNQYLLVCIFLAINLPAYLAGYRLNVDDIYYHRILLEGFNNALKYTQDIATSSGRIGQFISVPLVIFGSYFSDYYLFRIFYVALYFFNFLLFGKLVSYLIKFDISILFLVLAISIHPLGDRFLPPTAYPLLISLPFFLLILIKLFIETETEVEDLNISAKNFFLYFVQIVVLLFNEYTIIFGFVLFLLGHFLKPKFLVRRRRYFFEISALGVALLLYIVYRMLHPSGYSGNIPSSEINFTLILRTAFGHLISGFSLFDSDYFTSEWLTLSTYKLAAAGLNTVVIFFLFRELFPKILLVNNLVSKSAVSLICACVVVIPSALTIKYQEICAHVCNGIDSRISFFPAILAVLFFVTYLISVLSKNKNLVAGWSGVAAFILGVISTYTFLQNTYAADKMANYVRGWERARTLSCSNYSTKTNLELFNLIDPDRLINPRPDSAMADYWRMYIKDIKNCD